MKNVEFSETLQNLREEEVNDIENKYHLQLPLEYKTHILRFNGGCCVPSAFNYIDRSIAYRLITLIKPFFSSSRINYFYSIGRNDIYDLEEALATYKLENKRLPKRILPIAEDPFGNVICISCNGKDKGYVYFWDHEREEKYQEIEDDDEDVRNLHFIAKSFTLFLSSLFELKDE
jgi:hypothetical protein